MSEDIYDKVMTLAKRRGIIYPSSEIYGGIAGFYDYGPLGTQLKHNLENLWRYFFHYLDNCIEISTPTITLHEVLDASGHVEEFTDLTVDCNKCKQSFKVEDIIDEKYTVEQAIHDNRVICPNCKIQLKDAHPINLMFSTKIGSGNGRKAFLRPETAQGIFTNFHLLYRYNREKLPFGVIQVGKGYRNEISPRQGTLRQREFSMAEAEIFFDPLNKTHCRYNKIKNNELFLFDNDKEFKLRVKEAVNTKVIDNQALAYYMYLTQEFLLSAGVNPNKFRFRKHASNELAHYATECWDAELFSERFGWVECVGIADRSAYDLNSHITSSGTDMYAQRKFDEPKIVKEKKIVAKMNVLGPRFQQNAGKIKDLIEATNPLKTTQMTVHLDGKDIDISDDCYKIVEIKQKQTGEKFVPHVVEPSFGIDRIIYMLLEQNYCDQKKNDEEYRMLTLSSKISPIKVGVFPLLNDKKLVSIAQDIDISLRKMGIASYYDEGGTIGRRYARMDEIGTPFCITVDHDSLKDNTVTMRDRDTSKQIRIKKETISQFLKDKTSIE
jgi:glycyl-tRNA synthetase